MSRSTTHAKLLYWLLAPLRRKPILKRSLAKNTMFPRFMRRQTSLPTQLRKTLKTLLAETKMFPRFMSRRTPLLTQLRTFKTLLLQADIRPLFYALTLERLVWWMTINLNPFRDLFPDLHLQLRRNCSIFVLKLWLLHRTNLQNLIKLLRPCFRNLPRSRP